MGQLAAKGQAASATVGKSQVRIQTLTTSRGAPAGGGWAWARPEPGAAAPPPKNPSKKNTRKRKLARGFCNPMPETGFKTEYRHPCRQNYWPASAPGDAGEAAASSGCAAISAGKS